MQQPKESGPRTPLVPRKSPEGGERGGGGGGSKERRRGEKKDKDELGLEPRRFWIATEGTLVSPGHLCSAGRPPHHNPPALEPQTPERGPDVGRSVAPRGHSALHSPPRRRGAGKA
ncbi:uncharacterized protein INSYN1 isoform X2 [Manacus vitellinus]|uniref:uncharacterized protein INSYN1 isoform X2 n=1 Tax=Manacus vitellinus TaxID=328815 RepID=UPI00115CF1B3|nr:uncharacterized protein INSYN1 isoform X2 [Manacus vitellinus]